MLSTYNCRIDPGGHLAASGRSSPDFTDATGAPVFAQENTLGCGCGGRAAQSRKLPKRAAAFRLLVALVLLGFGVESPAQTNLPACGGEDPMDKARERAARLFAEARQRFSANPTNHTVAWEFGRAAFDWAEFATNAAQRAEIARLGIAACRQSIATAPDSAAAHYYLALNLGQLARTKSVAALKLVEQMESEFKIAMQLDAGFDHAGPHRSLGLLYSQTPGWPVSIGNRSKARMHLRKAVELGQDYPDNWLCLLEAHLKWNEKKLARAELGRAAEALRRARATFTGEEWAASWADWDSRWARIQIEVGQPTSPLKTPRGSAD